MSTDVRETPLYTEAVAFVKTRREFSADRLQRVLQVGFVMRDRLCIALEDDGLIKPDPEQRSKARRYLVTA